MERQDRLSDAQRDYVETIRGGVQGALSDKEYAYALDSFLNGTDVRKVVDRILGDRNDSPEQKN